MSVSPVSAKNKTVAILLAVFLGFWTWLYTYKHDAWKFWLSLSMTLAGMAVMAFTTINIIVSKDAQGFFANLLTDWIAAWIIAYIITGGLWIWGIVDAALKKDSWYDKYPD